MKTSQKAITTLTTIADTKTQIASSNQIIPSALKVCHSSNQNRSSQRTVSIMDEITNKKVFSRQSTQINLNQGEKFNNSKIFGVVQSSKSTDFQISSVLEKIFFKKKRYCFQVLKQFYLFPDQTQSSIYSLSIYDPLVFQEEVIHSLVKIMETRVITNKIWGFLNLKLMPYLKAARKIEQKVTEIQQKTIRRKKKYSFEMIKVAAQDAISVIYKPDPIKESIYLQINTSHLYSENKEVQCGTEQRGKNRKSYLSSNLIQEQVRPSIKTKIEPKPVCESTSRVYTREEYELKYGKMKEKNEKYEPKVVKISASEYPQRKSVYNEERTTMHTFNTTEYRVPTINIVNSEPRPQIQVPIIKQETKVTNLIKSPRKYNIIHYHERPREINYSVSVMQKRTHGCSLNNSCLSCSSYSPCANTCCCREQSFCAAQSRTSCAVNNNPYHQSTLCEKYQKNHLVNETRASEHVKFINGPKSAKIFLISSIGHEDELSELESRIEYLNFLKSLVKEQQLQQSLS